MHQNKVMAVRGSNSLYFASSIDNSGLRRGANEAEGIIQGLAGTIGRINPFVALATGAAAAFISIADDAYQLAKDFENAMKEVETISEATQNDFKDISNQVFELSKISPDGPVKLAKAYYQIVSAGYDGAEGLKLLETSAKAATAGVTTTETAADGITTVLNAFKLGAEDAEEVADALFQTVKLGKTNFEQLSSSLSQVAPLAAASGFEFREVLAAVATLTKQGVPTAQAMTQIRAAIEATTKVLGDGAAKSLTLQNAFQLVSDRAGGSQNKLKELTGSVEAMGAILSTTGENAKGAAQDLEDLGNSAGASQAAFERNVSSNVNQLAILQNRIKATTKSIGDSVLDMSNRLAGFLNNTLSSGRELEKNFNDQRVALSKLKGELLSTTEGSEDFNRIRNEILKNYPEFISGIDSETASTKDLLRVINQVNDAYIQRYKFAQRQEQLEKALREQGDLEIDIEDYKDKFTQTLAELDVIAKDNGVQLQINYQQSDSEILASLRKQLEGVQGAFDRTLNSGDKSKDVLKGFAQSYINSLSQSVIQQRQLNGQLEEQSSIVDELLDKNRRLTQAELNTASGKAEAIRQINQSLKESDFSDFVGSGIKEIEDAIANRLKIIEQLEAINETDSIQSLKPFLDNETEEIRKYAEKRKRILNTEYSGSGSGDGNTKDAFTESLKRQEQEYQKYEAVVNQIGKEIADKQFESLIKQGADYGEFLKNKLAQTKSFAEQQKIALAAENAGIDLNREKVVSPNSIKPITVPVEVEIDTASINAINRELNALYAKFYAAQTDEERKAIAKQIKEKEKRLENAEKYLNDEEGIYDDLYRSINDLSNKELRNYIKNWKEKLKAAEENSDEAIEAEGKIQDAQEAIAQNFQDTTDAISQAFGQLSSLFQKFGDEDTAKLLDQLAGVASGVGQIAKGLAPGGNPMDIIAGGLQVLNSALTIEVESDTEKFERAIKELNKAIDKLDYVISQSIGSDRVGSRLSQIEELADLERQANLAAEAEKEAEKQVKLLGITIGKKGKGSGSDQAKLEELADQAEEARRKAQELREELQQIYTGTTAQSITDSIIEGFRNGKLAAEDFADDFGDLMKDALLQAFQIKYLENEVAKFYDEFAEAGEDGKYTSSEIEALRNFYSSLINGAQSDLDAINAILEDSGIGALGADGSQKQGLSGAITSITEDTANILAGYLNAMRLDVRQGLIVNQQAVTYLAQIEINTRYNRYLESIDGRFASIESAILQFQAGG